MNCMGRAVSALMAAVSVPAAAAATARSAASDVSAPAAAAPGAWARAARMLSNRAFNARTSAASESTRRWLAGCWAGARLGSRNRVVSPNTPP